MLIYKFLTHPPTIMMTIMLCHVDNQFSLERKKECRCPRKGTKKKNCAFNIWLIIMGHIIIYKFSSTIITLPYNTLNSMKKDFFLFFGSVTHGGFFLSMLMDYHHLTKRDGGFWYFFLNFSITNWLL